MQRRARVVLGVCIGLAMGSVWFSAHQLRIVTSTAEMIAAEVPFRSNEALLNAAFPELNQSLIAAVSGPTQTARLEVLARLKRAIEEAALEAEPGAYQAVWAPALDPFFGRSGLLYLSVEELTELVDRLAKMQPLLATLGRDQSLSGLLSLLEEIVSRPEFADSAIAANLAAPIDQIGMLVESVLADELAAQRNAGGNAPDRLARRAEPLDWAKLVDLDARASSSDLLLIQPAEDRQAAVNGLLEARERVLATARKDVSAAIEIHLTGKSLLAREEKRSVAANAGLAGLLSVSLVLVLLILGAGAWQYVVAILLPMALGLIYSIGFATVAIGHLNLISVTFAILFIGLAVDFGIHLCLRCRELHHSGETLAAAVAGAVRATIAPLLLSALCAALGFLAFVPTHYIGLAELGLIAAAGMFIAFACNAILVPGLLSLLPAPRVAQLRASAPEDVAVSGPLKTWQMHLAKLVLAFALIAGIAALVTLPRVGFESDPIDLQDPNSEAVRTFKLLVQDPLRSPYVASVVVRDPKQARQAASKLNELAEVSSVVTLEDLVPARQVEKLDLIDQLDLVLGGTLALYATKADPDPRSFNVDAAMAALDDLLNALERAEVDSRATTLKVAFARLHRSLRALRDRLDETSPAQGLAASRLLSTLERLLLAELPMNMRRLAELLRAEPIEVADLPLELKERYVNPKGEWRVEVRPSGDLTNQRAMQAFASSVLRVAPSASGTPMTLTGAAAVVRDAFLTATTLAAIGVVFILCVALRSVRDVGLALFPLALSALLTLAATVWFALGLNFANIIALPLLFGLGIAGAIHVVSRWRAHADARIVLASSTSRAVLFSALTTCASFSSLAISSHRGMASMGMLLAVALAISLFCTLAVLPALLVLLQAKGGGPRHQK